MPPISLLPSSQAFQLTALDGYPLVATWTAPNAPVLSSTGRPQIIVMGCATAVPRGFYKRFCDYLASCGLYSLVTDYRGIGESKAGCPDDPRQPGRKTLKGFVMDYAEWSNKDLAAAVQYAHERGEVYLVGHSLGGHAIGQLPEPAMLKAAYICGGGAGWAGWMPPLERLKVGFMWNVLGPVCTMLLGYHPMSKIGLGEDIPYGVYRDWKRWCSFPRYFFDDPAPDARTIVKQFERVNLPIAAAVSVDDLWAPPKSRDAFFSGYTQAQVQQIDLQPHELGVASIGHMGYFRKEAGVILWPQILKWLSTHGLKTT